MTPNPKTQAIRLWMKFGNRHLALLCVEELIEWMPNKTDWDERTISLMEANGDNPSEFEWDKRYGKQFWIEVKQNLKNYETTNFTRED